MRPLTQSEEVLRRLRRRVNRESSVAGKATELRRFIEVLRATFSALMECKKEPDIDTWHVELNKYAQRKSLGCTEVHSAEFADLYAKKQKCNMVTHENVAAVEYTNQDVKDTLRVLDRYLPKICACMTARGKDFLNEFPRHHATQLHRRRAKTLEDALTKTADETIDWEGNAWPVVDAICQRLESQGGLPAKVLFGLQKNPSCQSRVRKALANHLWKSATGDAGCVLVELATALAAGCPAVQDWLRVDTEERQRVKNATESEWRPVLRIELEPPLDAAWDDDDNIRPLEALFQIGCIGIRGSFVCWPERDRSLELQDTFYREASSTRELGKFILEAINQSWAELKQAGRIPSTHPLTKLIVILSIDEDCLYYDWEGLLVGRRRRSSSLAELVGAIVVEARELMVVPPSVPEPLGEEDTFVFDRRDPDGLIARATDETVVVALPAAWRPEVDGLATYCSLSNWFDNRSALIQMPATVATDPLAAIGLSNLDGGADLNELFARVGREKRIHCRSAPGAYRFLLFSQQFAPPDAY